MWQVKGIVCSTLWAEGQCLGKLACRCTSVGVRSRVVAATDEFIFVSNRGCASLAAMCLGRTTVKGIAYNAYEVGRRACELDALGAYREHHARAIFGRENRVVGACQRACGACTDSSKIAGREGL